MTTSPVPSDTDQPADPIAEHAERMAAVPDEAVDIAAKMLEQVVSGHLIDAAETVERGDGDFEDYSPHPASIESDACAIVAAVTPILTASLQARLTTAEEQLATAKEIHKPEQRSTPDDGETSYDTYTDAAEVSKVTGIAPTHFEVCEHCGSIEMDAGATEYRDSLWPCDTARALGLGEGDSDA